jgi:hypothetical protein
VSGKSEVRNGGRGKRERGENKIGRERRWKEGRRE